MTESNAIVDIQNMISEVLGKSDVIQYVKPNSLFINNDKFIYISDNQEITIANKEMIDIDSINGYNENYGKLSNVYVCSDLSSWFNSNVSISSLNGNIYSFRKKDSNDNSIKLEVITANDDFAFQQIDSMSFQAYNYCISHNIAFPQTITKIDKFTFSNSSIEAFKVPRNVKKISEWAFSRSSLKQIEFNFELEEIDDHAFDFCSELTSLDFRKTKLSEFKSICNNCSQLTNIKFPMALQKIDLHSILTLNKKNIQLEFVQPSEKIIQTINENISELKKLNIKIQYQ